MDNAEKALIMIGGIILACLLIGLAFKFYNKAADSADIADQTIDEMTNAMTTEKYMDYDGKTVYGSSVTSAISSFKNETLAIGVKEDDGETYWYNKKWSDSDFEDADSTLSEAKDKSNVATKYINPSDQYYAEIIYAKGTDTIVGIRFTHSSQVTE